MDMIEKVARSICITAGFDPNEKTGYPLSCSEVHPLPELWTAYIEKARSAIEAMREPTEAMLKARVELYTTRDKEWVSANRGPIWQAMIDAALASPPPPISG